METNNNNKSLNGKKNGKSSENDILTDFTRQDIEKSYSIESINGTEAYYSNRYGWTLRRSNR